MRLETLHRVLISAGIGLSVVLVIYGAGRYLRHGDGGALVVAGTGVVAVVVLGLYLRWFTRRHDGPRPR